MFTLSLKINSAKKAEENRPTHTHTEHIHKSAHLKDMYLWCGGCLFERIRRGNQLAVQELDEDKHKM